MSTHLRQPPSALEGIGPATEEALGRAGVFTLLDLLVTPKDAVHRAARNLASAEEVGAWRSMARFLILEGMTSQWAEALVRTGLRTFSHLRDASLGDLETCFRDALAGGMIPDAPDLERLAALRVACAEFTWCGSLALQILLPPATGPGDRAPAAGAKVRLGGSEEVAGPRGRVLLSRIPMGSDLPLMVTGVDGRVFRVAPPPLARGVESLALFTVALEESDVLADEGRLSEFEGERLPVSDGLSFRVERREVDVPREGDHLVLYQRLKTQPVVDFTSYFRESVPGEWITPVYRLPRDLVSEDAKTGAQFRVEGGRLIEEDLSPAEVELLRRERRQQRFLRDYPSPQTNDETLALFAALRGVR